MGGDTATDPTLPYPPPPPLNRAQVQSNLLTHLLTYSLTDLLTLLTHITYSHYLLTLLSYLLTKSSAGPVQLTYSLTDLLTLLSYLLTNSSAGRVQLHGCDGAGFRCRLAASQAPLVASQARGDQPRCRLALAASQTRGDQHLNARRSASQAALAASQARGDQPLTGAVGATVGVTVGVTVGRAAAHSRWWERQFECRPRWRRTKRCRCRQWSWY